MRRHFTPGPARRGEYPPCSGSHHPGTTTALRTGRPALTETAQRMTNGYRGDRAAADEPVRTMPTRLGTEGIPASDVTHRARADCR